MNMSEKFTEFCNKLCSKRRRRKQLLLLEIKQEGITMSCMLGEKLLWQEQRELELPKEFDATYWQVVEDACREVLLWSKVQVNAPCLGVVEETLLYSESITLPALEKRELKQAVAWEIEQAVPWAQGTYASAYLAEAVGKELQVKFWVAPKGVVAGLGDTLSRLQLLPIGIVADAEQAAAKWYAGETLYTLNLYGKEKSLAWAQVCRSPLLRSGAVACLLLTALVCGVGRGACYLAARNLQQAEQDLGAMQVWQQRYRASHQLEQQLAKLKQLQQAAKPTHVGTTIEKVSSKLGRECWLQALAQSGGAGQWQATGIATGPEALQELLKRLQGSFKEVRLERSESKGEGVRFVLQFKEQQA
ncbi:hypothetical protein [Phascolarctobacterium sp.]|uniref:hypothetical protein n=1 Tax=Phascolarctobacterium sp. TaxID=2049039 RepID=UPI003863A0F4